MIIDCDRLQRSIVSSATHQPQITTFDLDRVLDSESGNVPKHLGLIADSIREWEGRIAEELLLTSAEVETIKEKHKNKLDLQK